MPCLSINENATFLVGSGLGVLETALRVIVIVVLIVFFLNYKQTSPTTMLRTK